MLWERKCGRRFPHLKNNKKKLGYKGTNTIILLTKTNSFYNYISFNIGLIAALYSKRIHHCSEAT